MSRLKLYSEKLDFTKINIYYIATCAILTNSFAKFLRNLQVTMVLEHYFILKVTLATAVTFLSIVDVSLIPISETLVESTGVIW